MPRAAERESGRKQRIGLVGLHSVLACAPFSSKAILDLLLLKLLSLNVFDDQQDPAG